MKRSRKSNGPVKINSEYLTEVEFCDRYGIATRTAQRWRNLTGYGPPYVRLGPRRIAYRLVDCEAWAAAQTRRPGEETP